VPVIKLGIVGDIHCGPDTQEILGSRAPVMLETFGEAMRRFQPRAIVDLGDRINDVAAGQDRQRSTWVRRQLLGTGGPVLHVHGNHDVVNLTKAELDDTLEKHGPYECVDLDGVRIILLDSQDPTFDRTGGEIGPEQQEWLRAAVTQSPHPVLVFCHHPLDEQSVDGHWYFSAHPAHALAHNRAAVRQILEQSGRVRAVFSGHLHWTRMTEVNGIPYLTLGSLVSAGFTNGRPCGTFASVGVQETAIDVQVAGLLPDSFRLVGGWGRPAREGSER
jgi:3',5'-cyclic-AMP phosphodiesterase